MGSCVRLREIISTVHCRGFAQTHLAVRLLGLVENSKLSNPYIAWSTPDSERGRASFLLLPKLTSS